MLPRHFFIVISLSFLVQSLPKVHLTLVNRKHSFYVVNLQDASIESSDNSSSEAENLTTSKPVTDNLSVVNITEHNDHDPTVSATSLSLEAGKNFTRSLMCYYNIPRLNDRPYAVFPEALNVSLCTHLVVCCAKVVNLTLQPNDLNDIQFYSRIVRLKQVNPKLKILLSLESINDDTGQSFVQMISTNSTRQRFLQSAINTLNQHGFDGIEVSWRFPCFEGPIEQRQLFVDFLHEFRDYINSNHNGSSMLLTAAVSARKEIIDIAYHDIPALARYLDYISLMSYDYHKFAWDTPLLGPNSPLFHMKNEIAMLRTLNVQWSANYWYQNGMPASKIIVGIPSYGRSYTLMNRKNHDYYDLAKGLGVTGDKGYVTFPEICEFLMRPNVTKVYNNVTAELYAYEGAEWISFENEQSSKAKVYNHITNL
ncbi:unnamed protein product [Orchesella dallaii]|uniref:GH18 domain-containing protein n=1 Tax=Orchesella dallaii TaxID=48710 RepID=A0ABP1R322_9HEXA